MTALVALGIDNTIEMAAAVMEQMQAGGAGPLTRRVFGG